MRDALAVHTDTALPLPDTGSVREDLRVYLSALSAFLSTPHGSALVRPGAVPDSGATQDERRASWDARLDRAETMVRRGVERGELAPDIDPRLLAEAVAGPLFSRVLLTGGPVDSAFAHRLVALALDGAAARDA